MAYGVHTTNVEQEVPMTKEQIGPKVVQVSQMVADGYRGTGKEECAIAASNTGVWILEALGFDKNEIRALVDAHRRS